MLAPPPAANALADQFENAAGEAAEWADALAETKPITYEETIDLMNTLQLNLISTIKVMMPMKMLRTIMLMLMMTTIAMTTMMVRGEDEDEDDDDDRG